MTKINKLFHSPNTRLVKFVERQTAIPTDYVDTDKYPTVALQDNL